MADADTTPGVRYVVDGAVAMVELYNPPVNGLGLELRQGLFESLQRAIDNDAIQAIVLRGAGRMFCGGADIRQFNTPKASANPLLRDVNRLIESSPKPVVAALHGHALGGGLELAMACQTSAVAKAAPDGYTLLMGTANLATNVPLFAKLPYDAQADLAPVTLVTKVPVYIFVNAASPIKDVRDLLARARTTSGGLSYATAGAGSVPHLAGEMFKGASKSDLVHIPYKGSSEAVTSLIGGQTVLSFDNLPPMSAYVKSGKARAIAIAMPQRSSLLPDVPTLRELGYPVEAYSWWGVLAPAGTPPAIIERLNKEIAAILKERDMQERFAQQGIEPVGSSPAEFAAHIRAETGKWSKVVKDVGIKPE